MTKIKKFMNKKLVENNEFNKDMIEEVYETIDAPIEQTLNEQNYFLGQTDVESVDIDVLPEEPIEEIIDSYQDDVVVDEISVPVFVFEEEPFLRFLLRSCVR